MWEIPGKQHGVRYGDLIIVGESGRNLVQFAVSRAGSLCEMAFSQHWSPFYWTGTIKRVCVTECGGGHKMAGRRSAGPLLRGGEKGLDKSRIADYCLKTSGGPLTRFPLRSTVTSTRSAIFMNGMPLFMP